MSSIEFLPFIHSQILQVVVSHLLGIKTRNHYHNDSGVETGIFQDINIVTLDDRCLPLCMAWGGVTKPASSIPLFPNFSASPKYTLRSEDHIYIWQVLLQLSCGDTCQIWMQCTEYNRYFCKIENFAYKEINRWSFSNPHHRSATICRVFQRKMSML